MRQFKFLNDDVDDEDEMVIDAYDGASWIFGRLENINHYQYEVVEEGHYGIHSFINNFPPGFIVCVLSITGPNGRVHRDGVEYEDGWGYDITRDRIIIEWVRFIN